MSTSPSGPASPAGPSGPRAWVDESGSNRHLAPGTYLLAAAVADRGIEYEVSEQMRRLRLPAQTKLHWRDESEKRRLQIIQAVADSPLNHVVVVRSSAGEERSERRRRKCLERLLYELERAGVGEVVLESRGPADDRRDLQMLNALRGQRTISRRPRLEHAVGRAEPMLWIPDAVCGAVSSARTGAGRYLELLGAGVEVIEI